MVEYRVRHIYGAVGLLTDTDGGAIVLKLEESWLSNISPV